MGHEVSHALANHGAQHVVPLRFKTLLALVFLLQHLAKVKKNATNQGKL
jgi:hypothetical protein